MANIGSFLSRLNRARLQIWVGCAFVLVGLGVSTIIALAAGATPLQPGENQGTADSFVGQQDWTLHANPGEFTINVMERQVPANALNGSPFHATLTVLPKSQISRLHFRAVPGGYVFSGSVNEPTSLTLSIIPPAGSLVRNALSYVITSSGNLAYGTAAGGDPIVGAYTSTTQGVGAVKFMPGGKVLTSNGDTGTWTLFDPATHLYVVNLGQTRYTVKDMPGQGLVNSMNGNIEFQAVH